MRHKERKWITALLIAVLAVACLQVGGLCSKKSALNSKLKDVHRRMRTLEKKIQQKEGEKRTVMGQLLETEQKLEGAQSRLSANKLELLDAQNDLNATVERLDRTKRQLARRELLLRNRVVDIYQGEDLNYANVVLGAADMWTFLTRAYYLQRILNSDTVLIMQINADKAAIEKDKALQARRVSQIAGLHVRLESQRNQVASLADAKRDQLDEIENSKELYEKAYDELLEESRRIEEKIQRYLSTPKGRARMARAFKGGLSWPCRGRITSRFGYRVHPITGVYKLHTGVDLSAPTGTPVCAAADGVCIISGWMGAYGYAVVIDHGGGVSTLYGHCSKLIVRDGDEVKKGQVIAKSGSTGYSTGPHVHFEKRVNGTPVNPF